MRARLTSGIVSAAVLGFAVSAMAFCPCGKKSGKSVKGAPTAGGSDVAGATAKTPCGKKCSKSSGSKGATLVSADSNESNSKVEAILASLPSMNFRVGEENCSCPHAAKAMGKKAGKPVQYTVADKVYDKKGDAVAALTSILEDRLTEMKTVQYVVGGKCGKCPVTAKKMAKKENAKVAYRVAGFDTFDQTTAEAAAKKVNEAIAGVMLSYKVGDASFCCDKMAGAKVKETGKAMTFVVGTEETPCATTAKLMLARAKTRTAVEAAAALMIAGAIGQS